MNDEGDYCAHRILRATSAVLLLGVVAPSTLSIWAIAEGSVFETVIVLTPTDIHRTESFGR